jgi:hypothetical protein
VSGRPTAAAVPVDGRGTGRSDSAAQAKVPGFDYLKTFYALADATRPSALGQSAPEAFEARHTLTTAA